MQEVNPWPCWRRHATRRQAGCEPCRQVECCTSRFLLTSYYFVFLLNKFIMIQFQIGCFLPNWCISMEVYFWFKWVISEAPAVLSTFENRVSPWLGSLHGLKVNRMRDLFFNRFTESTALPLVWMYPFPFKFNSDGPFRSRKWLFLLIKAATLVLG